MNSMELGNQLCVLSKHAAMIAQLNIEINSDLSYNFLKQIDALTAPLEETVWNRNVPSLRRALHGQN